MTNLSGRNGMMAVCVTAALAALGAESSHAASQRTYVASYGDDAGACTLVAPCRSFAAALLETLAGGEIIVLDAAGYAPVAIDRSVSIITPPGVFAGITAFSGDGVTITGTNLRVLLSGLTINGLGGANGVNVEASGSDIRLERVTISGFTLAGIDMYVGLTVGATRLRVANSLIRANQYGIRVAGANDVLLDHVTVEEQSASAVETWTNPRLHVRDSIFDRNGGFGLNANGFGASGDPPMSMTVERSTVRRNASGGIRVTIGQADPAVRLAVTVVDSTVSENGGKGVDAVCSDVSRAIVTLADSTISGNGWDGVAGAGTGCTLTLSHNVIAGNAGTSMVNSTAGSFGSFGDNRVRGNGNDTPSGTITMLPVR